MAPGPASTISAVCIAAGSFFGGPTLYDIVTQSTTTQSTTTPEPDVPTTEKYAAQLAEASQESLLSVKAGIDSVQAGVNEVAERFAPEVMEVAQQSVVQLSDQAAKLHSKLLENPALAAPVLAVAGASLLTLIIIACFLCRRRKATKSEGDEDKQDAAPETTVASGAVVEDLSPEVVTAEPLDTEQTDEASSVDVQGEENNEPSTPRRAEVSKPVEASPAASSPDMPLPSPRKAEICEHCGMEMGMFGMRGLGLVEKNHRAKCKGAANKNDPAHVCENTA